MNRNVEVYLYIAEFDHDPLWLADRLGICPDEIRNKGCLTPDKIISKFNSLKLVSDLPETHHLEQHIEGLLARIPDVEVFKRNLPDGCDIGVNTVIRIGEGEVSPRCGMDIPKEIHRKLADLDCNLDFDICA